MGPGQIQELWLSKQPGAASAQITCLLCPLANPDRKIQFLGDLWQGRDEGEAVRGWIVEPPQVSCACVLQEEEQDVPGEGSAGFCPCSGLGLMPVLLGEAPPRFPGMREGSWHSAGCWESGKSQRLPSREREVVGQVWHPQGLVSFLGAAAWWLLCWWWDWLWEQFLQELGKAETLPLRRHQVFLTLKVFPLGVLLPPEGKCSRRE